MNRHQMRTNPKSNRSPWLILMSLLMLSLPAQLNAAPALELGLTNYPTIGYERSIYLTWDAPTEGTYLVRRKDGHLNDIWKTVAPVKANVGPVKWMAPESLKVASFYQLLLPQPEIFSIEPAIVSTDGGTIHLLGQSLSTNGQVRIAGLVLPPNVIRPGTIYSCVVPPLVEGTYDVEWLENGQVVATARKLFSVTGQPTPVGEAASRLLEPPVEPPGSPRTSGTGPNGQGLRSYSQGHFSLPMDGRSSSLRSYSQGHFELGMDGKKGLNAVNVKLARAAASGLFAVWPHMHQFTHTDDDCDGDADDFTSSAVKLFSGEFQHQVVDLSIPGRCLDFNFVRTYRSRTGRTTPMGNNWDHSYNLYVEQVGSDIAVYDGTGRRDVYSHGTAGTFTCREFFNEGSISNNAFTLTFPDTGKWVFHPFDGSPQAGKISSIEDRNNNSISFGYNGIGLLKTIIDDLGRTNTLAYDTNDFIQSLTDFSGRIVTFNHHGSSTSSNQRGLLLSVISPPVIGTPNGNDFPNGKTTSYSYSTNSPDERLNNNLLSITDPKGQTWLQIIYHTNTNPATLAFDTVDHVQRGTYQFTIHRLSQTPSLANRFAVTKCILNDGVGNVTECFYDSLNRCVRQLDYTGRATPGLATTEIQNRPTGKLRAEDPDFFETLCTWNVDSLCTRITYPNGNATVCVYERDFDPNASARKKGDLRILQEVASAGGGDLDGDGVPDTVELTTSFEYDPRFGSPACVSSNMRERINALESKLQTIGLLNARGPRQTVSLDGSFNHGPSASARGSIPGLRSEGISTRAKEDTALSVHRKFNRKAEDSYEPWNVTDDFVVSVTDPRRNVTECTYDAKGNRIKVKFPSLPSTQDSGYDTWGRLTSITNLPNGSDCPRVDTLEYNNDPGTPGYGYLRKVTRDNNSNLCGTTTHFLIATTFEYDSCGNLTRCIDPRTNDWLFTYNSLDQLVRCQTPVNLTERCITDFTYDANDNLVACAVELRDETDFKYLIKSDGIVYDLLNRPVSVIASIDSKSTAVTECTYDANDNVTLLRSPEAVNGNDPHNVVAFTYDERNLLFRETHAPGSPLENSDEYAYDHNGNCTRLNKAIAAGDSKLRTWLYTYDGFDRCVSAIDPMGNVETCAFDANDNLVYRRIDGEMKDLNEKGQNRRLAETRCVYDALNRCTQTIESHFNIETQLPIGDGASTSTCVYAPNGQVTRTTDDNGHSTICTYDSACRLSSVMDPKLNIVSYTYDPNDNILSTTQLSRSDIPGPVQAIQTRDRYDNLNRLISHSDNVGNTNLYAYDSLSNLVRTTDPNGNQTISTFDGLSRCVRTVVDMDGDGIASAGDRVIVRGWNPNSKLVSSTDANTNTTLYAYNSLDLLTTTTYPDQTVESLIWSPRSNVALRMDPNGTTITNTYDLLDRCIRSDITPAPGVAATTTFEECAFDGLSRCVAGTNNISVLTFSYDSLGNGLSSTQDGLTTVCTFDGVGNCLSMTYPGGRVMEYTYDAADCVKTVTTRECIACAPVTLASYNYDAPDRPASITRPNGVNTRIVWNGLQNVPNPSGDFGWQQVSRINHARSASDIVDRRIYAYDPNQNKLLRAQTDPFSVGQLTLTNSWEYDPLNQMRKAINRKGTGATLRTYNLDLKGNRIDVTTDGAVETYTRDASLPQPADFQMDQYTSTPFGAQQHDHNGNLSGLNSADGSTLYLYDFADRLVQVSRTDINGISAPVASFAYDILGRCITKTTFPPAPLAPITTQFVHDGADLDRDGVLEERINGAVSRVYSWASVNPRICTCPAGFRVAASPPVAAIVGGNTLYYHSDELGNVLAITDSSGAVLERYEYDDYGLPEFLTSDGLPMVGSDGLPVVESTIGNTYLFHAMTWHAESPLYKDKGTSGENPLYEPKSGRLIGPSSIGSCSPMDNAYCFSGNNPWTAAKTRPRSYGDYLPAHNWKIEIDGIVSGGFRSEGIIHRDIAARNILMRKAINTKGTGAKLRLAYTGGIPGRSSIGNGSAGVFLSRGTQRAINTKGNGTALRGSISNVLKTKHDTAKNAIGNIR